MLRKRLLIALIVLGIVLLVLGSLNVFYVRTEANANLLWDRDTAYLFIGLNDQGRHFSYLRFIFEEIREIFPFGASAASDKQSSLLVICVTPDSIQRYTISHFWPARFAPLSGVLYVGNMLPGGALMKWSGTQLEPTTDIERSQLQLALQTGRLPSGPSYDNIEGWSKRAVVGDVVGASSSVEKDSSVTVELGGVQLTFVMNSGFVDHEAHVDLVRPDHPSQRVWSLNERPRRVSRAEYESIFEGNGLQ